MRVRSLAAALLLATFGLVGPGAWVPAPAQEDHPEISHEAEECIHKLEAGGDPEDCHEAPSPILPEANEVIWGGLAFFILLGLMWKFAYPGIKKTMDARAQRIRDNLDEADRTRAEAQAVLADYQRQLADAKNESSRIIEEARQTAEQMRRDLMARAEAEVAELRQRSQDDIAAAQQRALADLRGQVSGLAIELAEKVVEKNLDRETNLALIESYIEQVGARRQ
jgi:F-type H+-transporting ATPase subunit b